jgi:uncharacterized protein (TIGR02118 family)
MAELLLASWQSGAVDLPAGRRLVVADPDGDDGVGAVAWLDVEPEWVGGGVDVYETEPQFQWDDLDGRAEVIQLVFVRRHPDLTHDQFVEHWTTVHPPLARAHHPGLGRYVQHVITDALTPGAPTFDGVAELAFATRADHRDRMYGSDEDRAAIAADVATFLDLSAGRRLTGSELALP